MTCAKNNDKYKENKQNNVNDVIKYNDYKRQTNSNCRLKTSTGVTKTGSRNVTINRCTDGTYTHTITYNKAEYRVAIKLLPANHARAMYN